jgi:hypothetical protein
MIMKQLKMLYGIVSYSSNFYRILWDRLVVHRANRNGLTKHALLIGSTRGGSLIINLLHCARVLHYIRMKLRLGEVVVVSLLLRVVVVAVLLVLMH